jgi:hypothetical protein
MKRDGFSSHQLKQFTLWLRLAFLNAVEHDLDNSALMNGFNESDRFMIDLGCHMTGSAIVKMFDKSPGSIENLSSLEDKLENICKKAADCLNDRLQADGGIDGTSELFLLPSERPFPTSVPKFDKFELLLGDQVQSWLTSREDFKGLPIDGALDLFVDLSFPPPVSDPRQSIVFDSFPRAARLSDFRAILSWCCDKCNALRSKIENASPTSTLLQICSLVQFVFLRALPLPIAGSCWTSEERKRITAADQKICLDLIPVLTYHYLSASGSISYSTSSLKTIRLLTTASMFAVFDSMVRLEAEDQPHPFSVVLRKYPTTSVNCFRNRMTLSSIPQQIDSPDIAEAMTALLQYFEKTMPDRATKAGNQGVLFTFEISNSRFIQLSHKDSTFSFIEDLKVLYKIPPLKSPSDWRGFGGHSRENAYNYNVYSNTEKYATWITSNFDDMDPVIASYRNMNFIYRYMVISTFKIH